MSDEEISDEDKAKLETYMYLTSQQKRPKGPMIDKLVKKTGLSKYQLSGMIGHAMRKPHVYLRLRTQGFTEEQIPGWFLRPAEYEKLKEAAARAKEAEAPPRQPDQRTDLTLPSPKESPKTDETPSETEEPPGDLLPMERGSVEDVPPGPSGPGGGPAPVALSQQDEAYLRGMGVLQQADGRWVRVMPDGGNRVRYEEVDPRQLLPGVVPADESGKMISQLMIKEMDVQMQTIVRKIGLNPDVYQFWNWSKNRVDDATGDRYFPEDMDIGDFLCWCVKFSMQWAFGARTGIFRGGPNLMEVMTQRTRSFEPV